MVQGAKKQSEEQSGRLPAALIEKRIYGLYPIVEKEVCELGCSLRSEVEEFNIDLLYRHWSRLNGRCTSFACQR